MSLPARGSIRSGKLTRMCIRQKTSGPIATPISRVNWPWWLWRMTGLFVLSPTRMMLLLGSPSSSIMPVPYTSKADRRNSSKSIFSRANRGRVSGLCFLRKPLAKSRPQPADGYGWPCQTLIARRRRFTGRMLSHRLGTGQLLGGKRSADVNDYGLRVDLKLAGVDSERCNLATYRPKTPPRHSPGGASGVSISSEWGSLCVAEKVFGRRSGYPKTKSPPTLRPASCHAPPGTPGLSNATAEGRGTLRVASPICPLTATLRTRFSQVVKFSKTYATLKGRYGFFKRARAAIRRTAYAGPEGSFS